MIERHRNFEGFNISFVVTEACNLACVYCVTGDTKVTMADFSRKAIRDVVTGDLVLGFDEYSGEAYRQRRFQTAVVEQVFHRQAHCIKLKLSNGQELVITPNHAILNNRGNSKHSWKAAGRYRVGQTIKVFDHVDAVPPVETEGYKVGYLVACMVGDGSYKQYVDKNGYDMFKVRFAVSDQELHKVFMRYSRDLGFEFYEKPFRISKGIDVSAAFLNTRVGYESIVALVQENLGRVDLDYVKGFLAGIFDCEGSNSGCIRISQYRSVNPGVCEEIDRCLGLLGVDRVWEEKGVRVLGNVRAKTEFLLSIGQKVHRKGTRNFTTREVAKIVAIEDAGEREVFNIGTSTRTYVANTACVHNCYETCKRPSNLDLGYAQRFIDIILKDPDPINVMGTDKQWILERGLILDFIGGDALMRPQLCDQILQYFMLAAMLNGSRWASQWRASISTNGTLFDHPGVRDFLEKYKGNLSLGVSIDGCPEIHDRYRVYPDGRGTIRDIMKNWQWYLDYAGSGAGTKATLGSESIPYLLKSVRFIHEELGLDQINMNFIFEQMDPPPDLEELDRQLEQVVQYCLDHRDSLFLSLIDKNRIGHAMDRPDTGWCGSGAMPALSPNGRIYPCMRFAPVSITVGDEKEDMHVGDVWKGLYRKDVFERVRQATRKKISPPKCLTCDVESSCAWCVAGAFSENGTLHRQTHICEIHKLQSKWANVYWDEFEKLEGTREYKKCNC